jgi:hypothetical protein
LNGRATGAEHLETERVRHPERDPRYRERAHGAAGERRGERGEILVLDWFPDVADRHAGGVPDRDAQRGGALPDDRLQYGAAHAAHRPAQELSKVNQVRPYVRQRPGAGAAPVAPVHRGMQVVAVVTPVVPVEMPDRAEPALGDLLADGVDGR